MFIFSFFWLKYQVGLSTLGVIILVGVVNQWLLLPAIFFGLALVKLRQIYLATSRSIKRLEATSKHGGTFYTMH